MKLYHTGPLEIRQPDVHYGRKNADFGQGFYLTPDQDFTWRWAASGAVVNEYEMDLSGLRVHQFTRTEEWFQYIFHNRHGKDSLPDFDVLIGPIANDTIFDTMGIITSGFLQPQEALQLLLVGPEYTQIALKTEKAAAQLHWLSATEVVQTEAPAAALAAEKEEYQQLFAQAMELL